MKILYALLMSAVLLDSPTEGKAMDNETESLSPIPTLGPSFYSIFRKNVYSFPYEDEEFQQYIEKWGRVLSISRLPKVGPCFPFLYHHGVEPTEAHAQCLLKIVDVLPEGFEAQINEYSKTFSFLPFLASERFDFASLPQFTQEIGIDLKNPLLCLHFPRSWEKLKESDQVKRLLADYPKSSEAVLKYEEKIEGLLKKYHEAAQSSSGDCPEIQHQLAEVRGQKPTLEKIPDCFQNEESFCLFFAEFLKRQIEGVSLSLEKEGKLPYLREDCSDQDEISEFHHTYKSFQKWWAEDRRIYNAKLETLGILGAFPPVSPERVKTAIDNVEKFQSLFLQQTTGLESGNSFLKKFRPKHPLHNLTFKNPVT